MTEDLKNKAEKVFGEGIRVSSDPGISFNREKQESEDRSIIAKTLITFFLAGLSVIIILGPIYNTTVTADLRLDVIKILTTYSGILGPFVGVIAGYFFKK